MMCSIFDGILLCLENVNIKTFYGHPYKFFLGGEMIFTRKRNYSCGNYLNSSYNPKFQVNIMTPIHLVIIQV